MAMTAAFRQSDLCQGYRMGHVIMYHLTFYRDVLLIVSQNILFWYCYQKNISNTTVCVNHGYYMYVFYFYFNTIRLKSWCSTDTVLFLVLAVTLFSSLCPFYIWVISVYLCSLALESCYCGSHCHGWMRPVNWAIVNVYSNTCFSCSEKLSVYWVHRVLTITLYTNSIHLSVIILSIMRSVSMSGLVDI